MMKPDKLDLRASRGNQGSDKNNDGATIHSAPYLSARAPTMGPVMKVGAEAMTEIHQDSSSRWIGCTHGR